MGVSAEVDAEFRCGVVRLTLYGGRTMLADVRRWPASANEGE
jgi:hypothetical protein